MHFLFIYFFFPYIAFPKNFWEPSGSFLEVTDVMQFLLVTTFCMLIDQNVVRLEEESYSFKLVSTSL